ncbi:MAG: tRNA pseudouridine(13) synthase TruD [Candidatus Nanohaloarchaeota archaeon]|nr:tRNA pseudouridine(13) synthase TruD [Candidatus Nanohaloarchaeota archaeon]
MLLKSKCEDFIVEEETSRYGRLNIDKKYDPLNLESKKDHLVCVLIKKNVETFTFIQQFCKFYGISPQRLSFSGTKDKKAITAQLFSIYKFSHKKLSFFNMKGVQIYPLEYSDKKVRLGEHKGNYFTITIRKLTSSHIEKLKEIPQEYYFPNYYGIQRFGEGNIKSWMIGKNILLRNWEKAVQLILQGAQKTESGEIKGYEKKISQYLFHHNAKDYLGALKTLPIHVLQMYVHSFQSYVFNKVVERMKDKLNKDAIITLPGYGFQGYAIKGEIENAIEEIYKEHHITAEMFNIPELHIKSEGMSRTAWSKATNIQLKKIEKDDLNPSYFKATLEFFLPKGSYATTFIEEVLK